MVQLSSWIFSLKTRWPFWREVFPIINGWHYLRHSPISDFCLHLLVKDLIDFSSNSSNSLYFPHTEIQTDPDDGLYFRTALISIISAAGFWKHSIEVWEPHWNISTLKCWTVYPNQLEKTFLPSYGKQPAGKLFPYSATEKLIDAKGQWKSLETLHGALVGAMTFSCTWEASEFAGNVAWDQISQDGRVSADFSGTEFQDLIH